MGPGYKQVKCLFDIRKLAVLGLLLIIQIQIGCGGGRGGGVDSEGNPVGVGLVVKVVSGNNQGVKKGLPFPQPIVARVESPDGYPVPEMNVTCQETSNTDGYITGPTHFYTSTNGLVSTTVFAPSTYDVIMTIDCFIDDTPNKATFTLETVFTVDYLQWSGGNEPPNTHTVHHVNPMSMFQVEMIDTDGLLIDLTGGTRHWIDISIAEAGMPQPIGTTRGTFNLGIAEFNDVRFLRAGNYTVRATHNRSGKYVEKLVTFNPNVPTQTIVRLPGQSHYPGVLTLAEAFTGTLTALNVDNPFNVELLAVDDYFNQTAYAGAVSASTPTDSVDTEPGATAFVAGSATVTIDPVQAKSGWMVRPSSALATNNDSTSFTMNAGAPSQLIAVLPGQTFVPGQLLATSAVTGAPTVQIAGVPFSVTVRATDAEFNQVSSTPTVALATSDAADTEPANQALIAGTRSFNVTNITAGTQAVTPSSAGYTSNASTNFTVRHNNATQMVVTVQPPASIAAGSEIAPVVEIRDIYGNLVDTGVDATALVTMSLYSGTGALGGTISMPAAGGVANFAGLGAYVNLIGTKIIRLTKASTTGGGGTAALTVNTNSFTVTHGPAHHMAWTTSPASTGAGFVFNGVIEVRDQFDNLVNTGIDATATVALSIQSGTGALGGTTSKAMTAGVVSFGAAEGLNILLRGAKTLRATKADTSGGGGTPAAVGDSLSFFISHGPATQITWTTEPSDPTVAGADMLPVIEVQDIYGNLVDTGPDASVNITLTVFSGVGGATFAGTKVLTTSAGTATWTNAHDLSLDLAGAYVLRATKASTLGSGGTASFVRNTASFNIKHAPATQLVWTTQPTTPTVAGADITPTIEIRDPYGNLVTTDDDANADITLSLSAGTGTLNGTLTKAAVGGVVSFGAAESVDIIVAGLKTLTAWKSDESGGTGVGVLSRASNAFQIRHAAASQFTWATQPADPTVAGASINPVIAIEDTYGNVVDTGSDATAIVTLSLQDGTGVLLGTLNRQASAGVATFSATQNVRLNVTGAKTLRATKSDQSGSGGVASFTGDSNSFTIVNAPATTLVWTTQPSNPTAAGADITPVIEIRDTHGNVVTNDDDATAMVTLSLISGTGTLNGTVAKAAVAGVVTFTAAEAVNITVTGMKTLRATKSSTATGTGVGPLAQNSNAFELRHGPASQMVWTTQPVNPTGAGLDIIPVIAIRDSYGNNVNTGADATAVVTLSLQDGTGTLAGTLARAASNGVATFNGADNINIDLTGPKTLRATKADQTAFSGEGVLTKDSDPFVIKNAPATTLVFTTQPADPTVAGADILPVIEIRDSFGNVVTGDDDATARITLSLISGTGTLNGTVAKSAVAGIVSFTAAEAVSITITGAKTIRATKASTATGDGVGVLTQNSDPFTIVNAPASQLVWTTQPTNPTVAGVDLTPVIQIRDTYNNVVTADDDATAMITLSKAFGSGVLNGIFAKQAAAGIVTFTAAETVNFTVAGLKTLTATKAVTAATGALTANSSGFTINPAAATTIAWATEPADPTVAGTDLLPVIEIRDTYGNIKTNTDDATANITLAIFSGTGGATLSGTKTVRAVGGVVTWTAVHSLDIDLVGTYVLRATKQDMSGGTGVGSLTGDSASFDIVPNAATQLVFTTQPANPTTAGADLLPVIEIRDAYTNVVTNSDDATAMVTLSKAFGAGTLNGTLSKAAVNGVVTVTAAEAVQFTVVGVKTLTATKVDTSSGDGVGVLTKNSNGFTINHAPASKLVWTTQPVDPTLAGNDLLPVIEIRDTYDNVITGNSDATALVTLSVAAGTGSLNGTKTKAAVNGVVSFSAAESLDFTVAGIKTLTATKADTSSGTGVGVLAQDSDPFTINNNTATQLVWTTQPADPTVAGGDLLPVIEIRDTHGNVVNTTADATAMITLTKAYGAGTLNGTVAKQAANGVVSFTAAESLDFTVTGLKTLTATKAVTSATGAIAASSNGFTINNSPATQLVWTTHPANNTAAGADLLPVIEIRDTHGNVVTTTDDATALITLSKAYGTGSLNGTVTKAATNGVVSFGAAESVDFTVTGLKTLTATKADTSSGTGVGVLTADSNGFTIKNSPATTLAWTTHPSDPTVAGSDILVTIEIRDTFGNVVTADDDASADISLSIISGTGSLFGTTTKTAANGVVSFTATESVDIRTSGIKTLRATKSDESGGSGVGQLTQNSNMFTIVNSPATTLVYTTPFSDPTTAGANLLPVIEIRDTFGNVVTTTDDAAATITLSLSSGTGTLWGTLSKNAVNGIASFTAAETANITVAGNKIITAWKSDESGTDGVGPLSVASSSFEIRHATANKVTFTSQPPDPSTANIEIPMVVTVQDIYDNTVNTGADATALITLTKEYGTGALSGTTAKLAVAGVANFVGADVQIDTVGTKTLRATKSNQVGAGGTGAMVVLSQEFDIVPGIATQVAFSTEPANTAAGADILPVVQIRDAANNVVSSGIDSTATVTLSLFSGSGVLLGTVSKQAVAGVATWGAADDLRITSPGAKVLTATKQDLSGSGATGSFTANSGSFTITNAAATTLVFTTQPANPTTAGADLLPVIEIRDTYGNVVNTGVDATAIITLSKAFGTGSLNGTLSKAAVNGVATFTAAESVDFTVTGTKTLTATKADLSGGGGVGTLTADSNGFVIDNAAASQLAWTTHPADPTVAGSDLLPVIEIRDTYGNVVTTTADATAAVTLSKAHGAGTLNGTLTKQASAGVVSFGAAESVDFTAAGLKTLTATKAVTSATGAIASNSNGFTINNAAATTIAWTTQPADPTVAGADLIPVVEIRDTYGNPVTTTDDATALITMAIAAGPGGATLSGTKTVAAVSGVATWTAGESMDLDLVGTYSLSATKADTSSGTGTASFATNSAAFNIAPATASQLVWATQPTDPTTAGADILVSVEVRDSFGNVVTNSADATAVVTLSLTHGTGSLNGTVNQAAVNGVATFGAAQSVDITAAGLKTLTATKAVTAATGAIAQASNGFTINNAAANTLVWTTQPADNTPAGDDLLPVIEIRDTYGNVATTGADATAEITLSKAAGLGTLNGTLAKQASAGIVSFLAAESVDFTVSGEKTLAAVKAVTSASGAITVNSSSFTIINNDATTLVWTTHPTDNTAAGADLLPVIEIRDTYGNVVNTGDDATAEITLSKAFGSGTLNGTVAKQASAGVVSFLAADSVDFTSAGLKTLTATKAVTGTTGAIAADSNGFTIINAAATQLVWTSQPADPTAAGSDLLPVIEIRDTYGNVVDNGVDATAAITLSKAFGTGSLNGTLTKQAAAGVVSFLAAQSVDFSVTGLKTLTATKAVTSATGAIAADSNGFTIENAPATTLVWTTHPANNTPAGNDLLPVIEIRDTYGNVVTSGADATAEITLSKAFGAGSLNGTVAKPAASGVVSFLAAESVDFTVAGLKTLTATKAVTGATGALAADSNGFTIINNTATQLAWTTHPADPTAAGSDLLPVIEIRDTHGNLVTTGADATAEITLSKAFGTGSLNGTVAKQATGGVVSFLAAQSLDFTSAGLKTLTATKAVTSDSGALAADSNGFTITNADASQLVWTTHPADNTPAGNDLLPVIEIRDPYGNVVNTGVDATAEITLSKAAGLGSLNGTVNKQASNGVVSFLAAESLDFTVAGEKTLTATKAVTSATGTIAQNSNSFTIINNTATLLVWTTHPADNTAAGADLLPVIEIRDTHGNVVNTGADATAEITLSKAFGAGTLNGTVNKQAAAGVVSFLAAQSVDFTSAGLKTLTATKAVTSDSGALAADSNGFTIINNTATQLVWTTHPADNTRAGADLLPVIEIRDAYGNVVDNGVDATAQITLSKAYGTGSLNGTVAKQASAGVVSFLAAQSVDFTVTGLKTLTATKAVTSATGAVGADSNGFTIINAPASTLVWTTQPANNTEAGADLLPVIEIRDTYGNVVTTTDDAGTDITLAIASGPGGAVLGGTKTLSASSGVASWTATEALDLNLIGTYTLSAVKSDESGGTGVGAITVNSAAFTIAPASASQLVWSAQPADPTIAGADILVTVEIQDSLGNVVISGPDSTAIVTLSKAFGSGTLNGTVSKAAVAGVAQFAAAQSVDFTSAGLKTLTATKSDQSGFGGVGALTADSNGFTINNADANILAWTTQPADPTAAGADLLPVIEIRDTYGNVVNTGVDATAMITLSKAFGAGTLNGTVSKQAASGVVSFLAAESVDFTVSGLKTLTATKAATGATGAIAADSSGFTITNAIATKLVWTTQPANNTPAGDDLLPVIEIRDTYDNVVTTAPDATAEITLSKADGSGTLNGTLTKAAVSGVVSFLAAESVDFTVTGIKTLTATKASTAGGGGAGAIAQNSDPFTIINSAATQLVWSSQPADPTVAGGDLLPVIQIQDTHGNIVTSGSDATAEVTLSKAYGTGSLNGTVNKQATNGVVSFLAAQSVDFTAAGLKTLTATKAVTSDSGAIAADSNGFTIINAPASTLVWTTQPANNTPAGDDLLPVIEIRDTYGNVVNTTSDATANITLAVAGGPGGATLGGTKTVAAVDGVATWTAAEALDLDLIGTYTLSAVKADTSTGTGVGTITVNSGSFNIAPAAASSLVWTTQPTDPTVAGGDILVTIEIRDALGNVVVSGFDSTAIITLSKAHGAGTLNGTLSKAATAGVVSFTAAESVDFTAAGLKTLTATKSDQSGFGGVGSFAANSNGFTINNSDATTLVWTSQPANNTPAGDDLLPVIEIRDTFGNVVTAGADATAEITLSKAFGTGSLNGTVAKQATAGVVSFLAAQSVDFTVAGLKTLTATKAVTSATGALTADSGGFTIVNNTATQLVWTTQPADPTAAGADLLPMIEIRDTHGNVVNTGADATAEITLSKAYGTGSLNGTVAKQASAGVVSFLAAQALDFTAAGLKTLTATKAVTSDSGALAADSNGFTITNSDATQLVWTSQPADPTGAGQDLLPVIEIRDTYGNVVSVGDDATAEITLSKAYGTGTLNGTVAKQATNGVVQFLAAQSVDFTAQGLKTLTATKAVTSATGALAADSNGFTIVNGPATTLVWTTHPADNTPAGDDLLPVIEIRDTYGNVVSVGDDATAEITLSKAYGTGTLNGTVAKQATNGVVSFLAAQSLDFTAAGLKTLTATKAVTASTGALAADSNGFTIVNNTADTLVWTTQPADPTTAGADLLPVIEIRDTHGNVVTTGADATAEITLSVAYGTGSLNGTVAKQATAGIVQFLAAQSVDFTAAGLKTLTAAKAVTTDSGALTADSAGFTINNSDATTLVWTTHPADNTPAGNDLLPVIEIRDTHGNIVTTGVDATAEITLSKAYGTGTLNGTVAKQASAGVVSFLAAQSLDFTSAGLKTLTATKAVTSATGALAADSNGFTIINNTATQLVWTTHPADNTAAGADLLPVIEIRDTHGNVVTVGDDATAEITLSVAYGTGSLNGTVAKQATAGVVQFLAAQSVDFTSTGLKTLTATKAVTGATGALAADSNGFTIINSAATQLVWTGHPTDPTTAGADLGGTIEIRDTHGNVVTTGADATAEITLSKAYGTGTLNGTVAKQASNGVVSFGAGESVDFTSAGLKTLTATKAVTGDTGALAADSNGFTINNAAASTLAWTTQPANNTPAGDDLLPVVEIRDTYGNVVNTTADATAEITLAIAAGTGGATLGGTKTLAAVAGVATWADGDNLNLDLTGTYTLSAVKTLTGATGTITVNSASFNIAPADAASLAWTTQPTDPTTAGSDILVTIEILDSLGNVVTTGPDSTADITLSKAFGSGSLNGTLTKAASAGVASFTAAESVDFTSAGLKTITATKSDQTAFGGVGTLAKDSNGFTVNNAAASTLAWTTQPANNTAAGDDLLPVVEIRDTFGNVVTTTADATAEITLAIAAGTGGATLGGTKTLAAVAGVATWADGDNLNLDLTGTYTLSAVKALTGATGALTVNSASFNIAPADAASLAWTTQPTDPTTAGADILVTIEILDSLGNVVTAGPDSTAEITLSKAHGSGTLNGTVTKAATAGVVSFTAAESVDFTSAGLKTITATKSDQTAFGGAGTLTKDSNGFTVNNSAATTLVWAVHPANNTPAGDDLMPVIQIRDTYGNVVTTGDDATAEITLSKAYGTGTLNGTVAKQATAGVVSFLAAQSVDFTSAGLKTLTATKAVTGATGALAADSNGFTIINSAATKLVWTAQPANNTPAGEDLLPVIEIRDTHDNVVTTGDDATAEITLSKAYGTGTLNGTVAKQATNGVVSFLAAQSVDFTSAGLKTLTATKAVTDSTGAIATDSSGFTVINSTATTLVWTVQPTDPTAAADNLLPVIEIRDTHGNVVTSGPDATAQVTLSKTAGTGTLNGTVDKQASAGVVSFLAAQSVHFTAAGVKTLTATKAATTASGALAANSALFTITHLAASQLAWTIQPADPTIAGADLFPAVQIQDTHGNLVSSGPDATAIVTLTIDSGPGGATLGGTSGVAAAGGIAAWTVAQALDLDLVGTYTLSATKSVTAATGAIVKTSASFDIDHAAATQLTWSQHPADPTASGADLLPVIAVRDSFGNLVNTGPDATAVITLSKIAGNGTLSGTLSKAAVGGIATYAGGDNVAIDLAGAKTLRASKASTLPTGTGVATKDSNSFTITHAAASQLVFTTQPADPTAPGADILPVIEVRDPSGNLVSTGVDATAVITLSKVAGNGTLSGTLSKASVGGVATFAGGDDVAIDLCGSKTLRATKGAITRDSNAFTISCPAAPTGLVRNNPATSPNNDTTPEIRVSGVVNGNTVELYSNNSCTSALIGTAVAAAGVADITASPALTTATYTFYALQTDTYGNDSACSATNVTYDLDATNPSPATSLVLSSSVAPNLTTSPLFSWTASASGDAADYQVALGTASGATNVVNWTAADASTSHTYTALSLTACTAGSPRYWPSVRVLDGVGNISTIATHANGFYYDVTDPGAPGVPVAGADANNTQSATATWTAATDNCGVSHYEIAIGTTVGGTDKLDWKNVGNVLTYQAVNGVDGVSLTLSAGVYYYTSIRAIDVVGRSGTVVTSASWRYVVPPDTITNLAYSSRTSASIEVSWSAPAANGTPITDYHVQYKESSSGTWLDFDDGVSSNITTNVTGLQSSTSYDLRVRAYNGGAASWSNIVTIETAIDDPFFAPDTFSAFNLAGATTAAVVALEDDTVIEKNGVIIATLSAGQTTGFATAQGDVIEALKPIFVAGRLAFSTAADAKINVGFNTPEIAGKSFVVNAVRTPDHKLVVYAFENANVNIVGTGGVNINQLIPAGTFQNFTFTSASGAWNVTSDGLITMYQYSNGAGTKAVDGMPIFPPTLDLIGVPSCTGNGNKCWITTTGTNVTASYWYGNSNSANTIVLDEGVLDQFTSTTGSYGGPAVRFKATSTMGGRSTADGNGNQSASFIPVSMMRKRFAVNVASAWAAFASTDPAIIRVFPPSGAPSTVTLTRTGTAPNAPYFLKVTNPVAGTIYESDTRFAAWYEPSTDTGASSQDETNMFGSDGKGLPVSHKLAMWLDSGDSSTLFQNDDCTGVVTDNGQNVGCWRDKSYHGNNATQSGANKPTWSSSVGTFGGRGAVSFNGGANYLNFAQSIVDNTNYTIFVVMHRNGTTANSNFIGTQSAVGAQGLHLGFNTDTSARVGHDSGNTLSVAVEGQALNSVGIFWARLSSSGKKIYYNAKTGTDATATKLSNPGQGVIGRGLDADGLDGQIAEIIVYNRDLMDMEVDLIEEYLRDKWLNPSQAPNMRLWLDASDTSSLFSDAGCTTTTASGGNVRCWSDKSGSGYQAKQGSGTPIWSPDGGRNSVKFTSDNLVVSSGVVGALFDAGGTVDHMTVVALARSTSSAESGYLIHHSAGADITASIPFGANTVRMQVGGAGDGTVSSGAWGAGTVAPHYWFMSSTTAGPAQYIYRDNNLVTSDATASSVVIGTEDFYIGSDSSGANFQTANIHELLVFKRALTNAEREMLRAYFMNKWDL